MKTRLASEVGRQLAEDFHRLSARASLGMLGRLGAQHVVMLHPSPATIPDLDSWLGGPHPVQAQHGADLGERLLAALGHALSQGHESALALASDAPDLPPEHVRLALDALSEADAVIGPSTDGGYNYIGFRKGALTPGAFEGIPWDTGEVLAVTLSRLVSAGARVRTMDPWPDVDTRRDLQALHWRLRGAPDRSPELLGMLDRERGSFHVDTLSVIVPALHEAGIIEDTVSHVRAMGAGRTVEVVVVDGSPSLDTLAALPEGDAIAFGSSRGRAVQMNAGARAASGDVLLFLHADTRLPDGALDDAWGLVTSGGFDLGAFRHGFDDDRPLHDLVSLVNDIRARGTRTPWGDQAIFASRGAFEGLGGFPEVDIMEDAAFSRAARRARLRVGFVPKRVRTSPRRFDAEGGIVLGVARDLFILALDMLRFPPEGLARLYRYPHGCGSDARANPSTEGQ